MTLGSRRLRMGSRGFRRGAALRFLFLLHARFFLHAARFFGLLLLRGLVFDAAAILRFHALALAARGFLTLALGGFSGFDFLLLDVGLVLVSLVLLLQHITLDVRLLVTHFDVDGARAALRARLL